MTEKQATERYLGILQAALSQTDDVAEAVAVADHAFTHAAALGLDEQGHWHGPTAPNANWVQVGEGPQHGKIWKWRGPQKPAQQEEPKPKAEPAPLEDEAFEGLEPVKKNEGPREDPVTVPEVEGAHLPDTPPEEGARIAAWAARNGMAEWKGSLTPEEVRAIAGYQGGATGAAYLRRDSVKYGHDGFQNERVKALDAALAKAPPLREPVTALRGMDLRHEHVQQFLDEVEVGTVFKDRAFVSTTLSANYMDGFFAKAAERSTDVVIEVRVPAGVRAAYLQGFGEITPGEEGLSKLDKEQELLLPRGAKFKVVGKGKWKQEGTKITVEYLGSEPDPLPQPPPRRPRRGETGSSGATTT